MTYKKKSIKKPKTIHAYEVETKLFIHHVVKLFPDIAATEMRRFIAKHLGVLVGYRWVLDNLAEIKAKGFDLEEFGSVHPQYKKTKDVMAFVKQGVEAISTETRLQAKAIVDDSQKLARGIKGKMMDELDVRLAGDTEGFSNDELIRGSKSMHDIEHNTDQEDKGNINIVALMGGMEEFNSKLNDLKQKRESIDGEKIRDDGEGESSVKGDGKVSEG